MGPERAAGDTQEREGHKPVLKERARNYFLHQDYNCAESILLAASDEYDLGVTADSLKLLSGFGGGMGAKRLCGALAGCVAALGMMTVETKAHTTPGFGPLCGALTDRFIDTLGSDQCADLTPHYRKEGVRCVLAVEEAAVLLDTFLREQGIVKGEVPHGGAV